MSEFLVILLRVAYLAVLWGFILLATNVIRTDIYGHRVPCLLYTSDAADE